MVDLSMIFIGILDRMPLTFFVGIRYNKGVNQKEKKAAKERNRETTMFKESDIILYGTQGVCRVKGTVEKGLGQDVKSYYVLSPVYSPSSVIFVPMENGILTERMKPLLSSEEICEILRDVPDQDTIWIPDEERRKARYKTILQDGNRRELCAMLKTLYLHKRNQKIKGKSLHQCDERYLKEAEKVLYSEFAMVLNKQPKEMADYFVSQIG